MVDVPCARALQRDRASNADRAFFNPEEYISEKRAWSRRYTAGGAPHSADARPDRLFEHFAVVVRPGSRQRLLAVLGMASVAGVACACVLLVGSG